MSNHFPTSAPGDLELVTIQYDIVVSPNYSSITAGAFYFSSDVSSGVAIGGNNYPGTMPLLQFGFDTPGTFGSFDQDTVEAAIATWVTSQCQSIADVTGQTLADVQAEVTINRNWAWTDSGGYYLTYSDTLSYP